MNFVILLSRFRITGTGTFISLGGNYMQKNLRLQTGGSLASVHLYLNVSIVYNFYSDKQTFLRWKVNSSALKS